jgi:hypothetical protein
MTFPSTLSEELVQAFRELGIPHEVASCAAATTARESAVQVRMDTLRVSERADVEPTVNRRTLRPREGGRGCARYKYLRIPLNAAAVPGEAGTSGEISPSFTAVATVTGLVTNSQMVAAASTMLTIAIR